jgi:hypothetical protein
MIYVILNRQLITITYRIQPNKEMHIDHNPDKRLSQPQ